MLIETAKYISGKQRPVHHFYPVRPVAARTISGQKCLIPLLRQNLTAHFFEIAFDPQRKPWQDTRGRTSVSVLLGGIHQDRLPPFQSHSAGLFHSRCPRGQVTSLSQSGAKLL